MQIRNARQYPTALVFGKRSPSEHFLAVLIKATFRMNTKRGPATAGALQLPICKADEPYHPDDPASPLRFESDLVPFKPRADIILVGSAYAPAGRPRKVVDVHIQVGAVQRALRVFGDRLWSYPTHESGAPIVVGPAEFLEMPLTYERAFGGIDKHAGLIAEVPRFRPWCARNFAGKGFIGALSVASVHKKPLPNIEDPHSLIESHTTYPAPVGCGFFPRNSEPRSTYAGTHDEQWHAERAPEAPLDFDFACYNAADPSLQVEGYLRGDEPVLLTNVAKNNPSFEFYLPGIRPTLSIVSSGSPSRAERDSDTQRGRRLQNYEPRLDTLVFLPDSATFFQIWRAIVPIPDPARTEIEEIRIEYQLLPSSLRSVN